MKIQVEKKNDKGETIKGPDGKAVTEEQTVTDQNIVQGPMASQVAIKMLGTNGGGYINANAAHPFENPTPLSNFFQMLSIFSIGSGLTYYLGRMVKNQKHGWTVWAAMLTFFLAACCCAGGRRRMVIRSTRVSVLPAATWRARKSDSAFSIPHSSPRSRLMPPAARSIRCTIRSPRWAASCRCSTFSSAKSSSAASAPDYTGCWFSLCSRCSSRA